MIKRIVLEGMVRYEIRIDGELVVTIRQGKLFNVNQRLFEAFLYYWYPDEMLAEWKTRLPYGCTTLEVFLWLSRIERLSRWNDEDWDGETVTEEMQELFSEGLTPFYHKLYNRTEKEKYLTL